MPPSRRRERRRNLPGMVRSVDITSGHDQYIGTRGRAPKPQTKPKPQPGALPKANPAAAVARQEPGPMTGGLAPKPLRPTTPQETKRGPIDKIAQSRLWKMFFGPDGQGGGPQATPVGPGPAGPGTVPDISVMPGGSLQYKDALSGRTVIIGPRATEADVSRGKPPVPGEQFGESAVTMKDGRMVLTGPERPEAAAAGAAPAGGAPAAARTNPLSAKELREIKAEKAAASTLEAKVLLHEHFIEKYGDLYLQSSEGRGQDEAMTINRQILDRTTAKQAGKDAKTARLELDQIEKNDRATVTRIISVSNRKFKQATTAEQRDKIVQDAIGGLAARGIPATADQLERAGLLAPSDETLSARTWEPKVAKVERTLTGQMTQGKFKTAKARDDAFTTLTKDMPAEWRTEVRIPRMGKTKAGVEDVSIVQGRGMARKFLEGGKQSFEWGPAAERRAVEFATRKEFIDTYPSVTDDVAARNVIMLGSTLEGKVPSKGETAAYPGLLRRYKDFEKWATGWSPVETKKAWLRTLHEAGRGDLAEVWQQWKGHTGKEWADAKLADTAEATVERRGASDAGAQAAGKAAAAEGRAGGKPKPTPEQMREAFEATKSKQEARELLREQGFDI